jgi:hypothetical protein
MSAATCVHIRTSITRAMGWRGGQRQHRRGKAALGATGSAGGSAGGIDGEKVATSIDGDKLAREIARILARHPYIDKRHAKQLWDLANLADAATLEELRCKGGPGTSSQCAEPPGPGQKKSG